MDHCIRIYTIIAIYCIWMFITHAQIQSGGPGSGNTPTPTPPGKKCGYRTCEWDWFDISQHLF